MLKPSDLNCGDMQVVAGISRPGYRLTASDLNMSRKTESDLQSSFEITQKAIEKAKKK
ncbi:hypothetical protein [Escherichia phage vB_EcoM_50EP]|nr:hypothetical protein [Escherichia phage vB_EcoM_50EP]